MTRAQILLGKRVWREQQYWARKLAQVCIDCEAELEESDGVRCWSCEMRDKEQHREYRQTARGRNAERKRQNAYRASNADAGRCIVCGRDANGRKRCAEHLADAREATQRWRERKAAGVVVLATERQKRRPNTEAVGYVAIDEKLASPRIRILRALEHHDWIESSEIMALLGVAAISVDKCEHDVYSTQLSRLVKAGAVERRGEWPLQQYRISEAGCVELADARRVA